MSKNIWPKSSAAIERQPHRGIDRIVGNILDEAAKSLEKKPPRSQAKIKDDSELQRFLNKEAINAATRGSSSSHNLFHSQSTNALPVTVRPKSANSTCRPVAAAKVTEASQQQEISKKFPRLVIIGTGGGNQI